MSLENSTALSVWEKALPRLQARSESVFRQYFVCMQALELTENVLHLGVPDDFFRSVVEDNYGDLLSEALLDIDGVDYRFEMHEGYPIVNCAEVVETCSKTRNNTGRFTNFEVVFLVFFHKLKNILKKFVPLFTYFVIYV